MRRTVNSLITLAAVVAIPATGIAQAQQGDAVKGVANGGIFIQGWTGKIDASRENTGLTLNSARLASEGDAMHVTTGPAAGFWNPANKASGNYTVSATFKEPAFQGLNTHAHPYGIIIDGNDLGTDTQSYL